MGLKSAKILFNKPSSQRWDASENRSQLWSAKDGRKLIFSDFDEKLWAGKFAPENSVWYSNHLLAEDTLSTILQAAQLPVFQP